MHRAYLRKIVNTVALLIFILSAYYLSRGNIAYSIGYLAYGLALLTPRYLYNNLEEVNSNFNRGVLSTVEMLISSVIVLSTIGYLWLFHESRFFNFDSYAHFIIIFLLTIVFAIVVAVYTKVKSMQISRGKVVLACVGFAFTAMLIWELFEYSVSAILGVQFYGQIGQPLDTMYDIIAGAASIPLASVLIYKYLDSYTQRWHKFKDFVKDFNN